MSIYSFIVEHLKGGLIALFVCLAAVVPPSAPGERPTLCCRQRGSGSGRYTGEEQGERYCMLLAMEGGEEEGEEEADGTLSQISPLLSLQPQFYQRRGAEAALSAITRHFGPLLLPTLPSLWSHITSSLHTLPTPPQGTKGVYKCAYMFVCMRK